MQLPTILIVQNSNEETQYIKSLLQNAKVEATFIGAFTPEEYRQQIKKADIIIANLALDTFREWEVLHIHKDEALATPFFCILHNVDEHTIEKVMKAGVSDCFFTKRLVRLPFIIKREIEHLKKNEVKPELHETDVLKIEQHAHDLLDGTQEMIQPNALIIEDDPIAAEVLRLQLIELGLNVTWKTSAQEALEMHFDEPPDLILLDIHLPGMCGLEFMEKVKENDILSDIPIIVVSVSAEEQRENLLGAADVLQKPIGKQALMHSLEKFVMQSPVDHRFNVLVIEKDKKAYAQVKEALKDISCNIVFKNKSEVALEYAIKSKPEVIIANLSMPKIEGADLMDALKEHPNTSNIPVVVLSSNGLSENEKRMLKRNTVSIFKQEELNLSALKSAINRVISH